MKKALTRGEKWLFASPLLLLAIARAAWMQPEVAPDDAIRIGEGYGFYALEFSPDSGRLLVTYNPNYRGWMKQVYDVQSNSKICDLALPAGMREPYDYFSWSGDGQSIIGSDSRRLAIWDAHSGAVKVDSPYASTKNSFWSGKVQFSPDGRTLVGEGVPPTVYDAKTIIQLRKSDSSIGQNELAGLSRNGRWLAINKFGKKFQVLDYQTKRVIWQPEVSRDVIFEWFGELLCVYDGSKPRNLLLWNARTRQQLPSPPVSATLFRDSFKFSPNGRTLACINVSLNPDSNVEKTHCELVLWDYRAHRVVWRYPTSTEAKWLQWSPDGKWLAALASPSKVQVFDQNGKLRYERKDVEEIRFSPDSQRLAMVVKRSRFLSSGVFVEIHRFAE